MRGHIPGVVARFASRLPLFPLELISHHLIANTMAARPSFARRLAEHAGRTFAIDPIDCPFAFLIILGENGSSVRVVRDLAHANWDARIAAPLLVLLGMANGVYDGDALFFSRDLIIERDTEAVLALRNALENAELDPASVLDLPKAWRGGFNRLADLVFAGLRRALDAPLPSGPAHEA
jgi:predicted lipid carrier protein YhbT